MSRVFSDSVSMVETRSDLPPTRTVDLLLALLDPAEVAAVAVGRGRDAMTELRGEASVVVEEEEAEEESPKNRR